MFWKFFLAFWVALLVAGVGVGTAVWIKHTTEAERNIENIDDRHGAALLDVAEIAFQHGGLDALRNFLGKLQSFHFSRVYAVDEQDRELLMRKVEPSVLNQARSLLYQTTHPDAIRLVSATDGQHYLLFAVRSHRPHPFPPPLFWQSGNGRPGDHAPPPGSPRHPSERYSSLLSIVIGLLASLLFSAVLAWYFARPIRSLRQAFSAVAQGDLDTRVGPMMGRRRDELSDLGRDFDHMVGQIRSLVNAQQRLLHDVSHELRSPLARIQAAIGLVQQQPEKAQATMERIERETQRISDLVGELLVLSRLEAGVSGEDNAEFDIGGLLDDVVEDARFEADQLELQIRYAGIDDTPVKGCGELLHRAFENVLRNALQHCKKGGVIQVIAGFNPDNRLFQLCIDDQGPGVAESDLSAIFEPFFRSGKTTKAYSTGLGLGIAKRSIVGHGGLIQASNRPEGGLRVKIDIPFPQTFSSRE
ncbi:MAG: histidine kinase dimerization/phospho-acceptor domain-containing protein [Methylococcales bacterium]|nr:histidine kinase dimerization/phospho-acceptor domain-containing protein [Methylococcales bacterium]